MKFCALVFSLLLMMPLWAEPWMMSPIESRPKPLLDLSQDLSAAVARDIAFYEQEALPFYRTQLVEGFDASKVAEKYRARVMEIREGLARYYAAAKLSFAFPGELKTSADALYKEGCRDPAVLLATCINAGENFGWWTAPKRMREALKQIPQGQEPLLRVLCAQMACGAGADKDRADFAQRLREAVKAAQPLLSKAHPRVVVRLMRDTACHDVFVHEDYHPYLRACLNALDWMGEASAARGSGWASSVTEEGWKGWEKMNGKAREALAVATCLCPDWPEAILIRASLEGRMCGGRESLKWMNRALNTSPDAAREVHSVTHFLTTRWGGSTQALRELVENAATTRQYRSLLSYYVVNYALSSLMRYELNAFRSPQDLPECFFDPGLRAKLYAMAEGYLAEPNKPSYFPHDNVFAMVGLTVAAYGRDWDKVRHFRAKIQEPLWASQSNFAFSATPMFCNHHMARFARALAQLPGYERLILAEELLDQGAYEQAINLYDGLLREPKLPTDTLPGLECRRLTARIRQGVAQGTPIDLMPSPGGNESEHWYGRITTQKDGRARNRNNKKAYAFPKLLIPCIGLAYEARIHFIPDPKGKVKRHEIVWGLAHPVDCDNVTGRPALRFVREGKEERCEVLHYGDKGRFTLMTVPLKPADSHTFTLAILSATEAKLWIDGEAIDVASAGLLTRDSFQGVRYDGHTQPIWELHTNVAYDRYLLRPLTPEERARPTPSQE